MSTNYDIVRIYEPHIERQVEALLCLLANVDREARVVGEKEAVSEEQDQVIIPDPNDSATVDRPLVSMSSAGQQGVEA